jgi:hypothetical protein
MLLVLVTIVVVASAIENGLFGNGEWFEQVMLFMNNTF